jgi:hypothetical protein
MFEKLLLLLMLLLVFEGVVDLLEGWSISMKKSILVEG